MPITAPRTTRELATPEASASMPMICGMPWPTMVMMVSSSSRPGNDIHASTSRCTARSTLPPTNPATPQQRRAQIAAQEYAAHPAAILHVHRHVQPQPPLKLRPIDVGAAAGRLRHPEHEEVDGIARYEPHREEHQSRQQEEGGDQQQDAANDVCSHLDSDAMSRGRPGRRTRTTPVRLFGSSKLKEPALTRAPC